MVRKRAGFTLIEVMVVVVILGILAALIVPKVISRPDDARIVAAKQDIASIVQALKLYRLDIGHYPTREQGLLALVQKPVIDPIPKNWKEGGYLDKLPNDPWGESYHYEIPGAHGEIDVYSNGSSGSASGDSTPSSSVIGSWDL
ncbi:MULTISPECIES: type II secretion system major pseudopilin GspG [Candidatus Ichthyocystis]|uniref:Type II secretion system core protein G n=1 Tax=Candidatus Ichthyocystis hellenicum TaxID=1561003 RepID=A0A0S4M4I7_9BURK|nr:MULTISPECIES: type II secretion system major pseudopilin GspG [Ichthyocystis]CUT17222.1 type II secretion system protein G [Candidatus Ichthyocystis hellenicum]